MIHSILFTGLVYFLLISCFCLFAFADVMEDLYNYVNPLNKRHSPMISKELLEIVLENKAVRHFKLYDFLSLFNLLKCFLFYFLTLCPLLFAAPQLSHNL